VPFSTESKVHRSLRGSGAMAFTRQEKDPTSGELRWVTTYLRNGRLVTQRLPRHLFLEGLTAARAERLADFAEAAARGFGQRQTTYLPPAAEMVRREKLTRASDSEPRESSSQVA
jgi:hypothetical protein